MVASLADSRQFYFYLTLADDRQVVQLPIDFNAENFRPALDAGLKRFAQGFTKIVAFVAPQMDLRMARMGMTGPGFSNLEAAVTENNTIRMEDLSDGSVSAEADLLVLVAPENLDQTQLFAIDQFLMRGGSIVIIASPFISQLAGGNLAMINRNSGLQEWLQHHGIEWEETLVLDPQNTAFPVPVTREVGGFRFEDVALVDYPYFIDARSPGLNPDHPITSGLPQVTMSWASPLLINEEENRLREVTPLISSSGESWTSASMDVLPRMTEAGISAWQAEGETGSRVLAAVVGGRFDSWFAGKPSPLMPEADAAADADLTIGSVIERSPESSRLIIYASNDFLTDQILGTISSMSGGQYLGPLQLIANTLDWALEDGGLLGIRSHAHFNRSLPPLEKDEQLFWEYLNYALALMALIVIALWQRQRRLQRQQQYLQDLGGMA
jgi:ABC-2 type transport system permease protein